MDFYYEYYVAGCTAEEIKPLSQGRFDVIYGAYLVYQAHDYPSGFEETVRQIHRRAVRQYKWLELARLVKLGYELLNAQSLRNNPSSVSIQSSDLYVSADTEDSSPELPPFDYEYVLPSDLRRPGDTNEDPPKSPDSPDGGVRVPRNPTVPVLIGAAARALPKPGEESYIVPWHY